MSVGSLPTRRPGWSDSSWTKPKLLETALSLASASEVITVRQTVLEYYDREHVAIRRCLIFSGVAPDLAEDAVQEAFLRLQVHLERDGDQTNLRAWLYRVAHNLALHELQASHRRLSGPLQDAEGSSKAVDPAGSPEQDFLLKERSDRVRTAIAQLSEVQRQCVVMRAQGLRFREIAEVLDLSVSTVAEHVQRGLQQVRDIV